MTPRISIGTTYSDNIRLTPANEAEEDIILQVDPGISVRKRGGRLDLRLDYTAQGLLYTNNGDANKINNQLQAFGTAELFQGNFFLDAYGSVSYTHLDVYKRQRLSRMSSTMSTFVRSSDVTVPRADRRPFTCGISSLATA